MCAPSRATFLRGQYAQNTGIHVNKEENPLLYALEIFRGTEAEPGQEASTLATWFKDDPAGYRTGLVGKYMNGYGEMSTTPSYYTPPGWDYFVGVGGDAGQAQNYWLYENGTMVYHGTGAANYLTNVLNVKAVEFVQNALTDGKPFFLVVTPKAPHHPADYASLYGPPLYDGVEYPTGTANPAFNELVIGDKPDWIRSQPQVNPLAVSEIHEFFRRKLRALRSVDDLVGDLVDAIGDEMDNTYLVFCSDNGFHSGEHRLGHGNDLGGKNTIYEEDIRVPFFIRGPGITAGSTVDELIGNVDLAPTLCALAGVTPDPTVELDGRSFAPLVTGGTVPEWRKYYLLTRLEGTHRNAGFRAEYTDPVQGLTKFTFGEYAFEQDENQGEYYDLNSDAPQINNGYNDLLEPTLLAYQTRLGNLSECHGDTCRAAEV